MRRTTSRSRISEIKEQLSQEAEVYHTLAENELRQIVPAGFFDQEVAGVIGSWFFMAATFQDSVGYVSTKSNEQNHYFATVAM